MKARLYGERVEVHRASTPDRPQVTRRATDQTAASAPADGDPPYVAPDRYGLRVAWQSDAEQVEAAEFMLATRAQEEARRRVMRMVDRLRRRDTSADPAED